MKNDLLVHDGTTFSPLSMGIFNVRNYGAKGDGATDDRAAIQAAITAAGAQGGKKIIYFPDGIYRLNAITSSGGINWHLSCAVDDILFLGAPGAELKSTLTPPFVSVFFIGGVGKPPGGFLDWWKSTNCYVKYENFPQPAGAGPATHPMTGVHVRGSTSITLTSGGMTSALAAGLAIGSYIFIRTGITISNASNTGNPDSELNKVRSISGNTIQLERPLAKTYQQEYYISDPAAAPPFPITRTSPTAWPAAFSIAVVTDRTQRNVAFRGLRFRLEPGPAPDISGCGLQPRQVDGLVVEDCFFHDCIVQLGLMTRDETIQRNTAELKWAGSVGFYPIQFAVGDTDYAALDNKISNADGACGLHVHEGSARGKIARNLIFSKSGLAIDAPAIDLGGRGHDIHILDNTIINSGIGPAISILECPGGGRLAGNIVRGTYGTAVRIDEISSPGWEFDYGGEGDVQVGRGIVGTVRYLTGRVKFTDASTQTVTIGVLPNNSMPLQPTIRVEFGFSGGGTSNHRIKIGYDGFESFITEPVDVSSAVSIQPDQVATYVVGGAKTIKVYYTYTGGTGPTAGQATVVVPYAIPEKVNAY